MLVKRFLGNAASVEVFKGALGKTIAALSMGGDEALHLEFTDGTKIRIFDAGQSCCEARYMRTDDDLSAFVGAKLLDAEIKPAPDVEGAGEVHEVQFLEVKTDQGVFTMSSHNEHNGYYGGFAMSVEAE